MEHSKETEAPPPPYPGEPSSQSAYASQPGYPPHQSYPYQPGYPPQPGMQPAYSMQPGMHPGYSPQPGMHPGYSPQPGMHPGYSSQPETKTMYTTQLGPSPNVIHVTPNMAMGPGGTTVISPQAGTTVVTVSGFTPFPMNITCPNCSAQIMTLTSSEAGIMTFVLCGALVVLGCWIGCCLIPFCIPECQDIIHTCPNCKSRIGMYRRC